MDFDAYGNPYDPSTFLPDDMPSRRDVQSAQGPDKQLSEWAMLARGKTLGKSININYTGSTNPATSPNNMFEVSGNDEDAFQLSIMLAPPKVYGRTFTSDQLANASGSQDNRQVDFTSGTSFGNPFATIEWGIGGVSALAEADILNGLHLTVSASWLRIGASIDTPGEMPSLSTAYQIAAFVGPGRPKDNNAQRTLIASNVAINVQSAIQATPRFAKKVYLIGANNAHTLFVGTIRFFRDSLGADIVGDVFFSGNALTSSPIPNGGYYFAIVPGVATDAPHGNFVNAVFELSI